MRLFLYGTLIEASDTPAARWLRPKLRDAVRASVPGRLMAIRTTDGCYPAILPGRADERTFGLCCTLDLRPGDLAWLDRYEGAEYRRTTARVRVAGGGMAVAQLYRWRGAQPPRAEPIPGGDFLAWLAQTGARPYASRMFAR